MTHSRKALLHPAAIVASLLVATTAAHADQKILLENGAWRAVEATQGGERVCFVISSPTARAPADLKRDPGNLFVTTKAAREGGGSEISIRFGFPLAPGAHTLTIDGRALTLMPQGETAWLQSAGDEKTALQLFRAGRDLQVSARSARGNATVDTYSLIGFSAAFDTLERQCRP
ncbi:MAG: hypothetical protein GX458_08480 [Phyllobacteriaceae bacterium]|nr:hypothetical protein [Phyllobacteriaceae bacterium]